MAFDKGWYNLLCYIIHFCILLFVNTLTTLQNQTVLHQFLHDYLVFLCLVKSKETTFWV